MVDSVVACDTVVPMSDEPLGERIRRERGKAVLRALHAAALEDAGAERALALERAEHQLDRIARLLPDSLAAGLGMTEIARATGVSRPTLYEMRARYGDAPRDLRLAVMQALMSTDTSNADDLSEHLGRPRQEIAPVVNDFLERGWIDWDFDRMGAPSKWDPVDGLVLGDQEANEPLLHVTLAGLDALERWKFEDESAVGGSEAADA